MRKNTSGFTLVELLIVIIVIAILATISVVAFNGIQQRARDAARASHMELIAKALEMYYIDNGSYPSVSTGRPCVNETGVARSGCANWTELESKLATYLGGSRLPTDPKNRLGSTNDPMQKSYYYWPFTNNSSLGCPASAPYQSYYLTYFPDNPTVVENTHTGSCANLRKPTSYFNNTYSRANFYSHP